jgi:hypothetical protein
MQSPKHYDKFTYAARRKPETDTVSPRRGATSPVRAATSGRSGEYTTAVAGIAALPRTVDGFAIAEDGTIQSRFVSAPRFSAAHVALMPMSMPYGHVHAAVMSAMPTVGLLSPQQVQRQQVQAALSPGRAAAPAAQQQPQTALSVGGVPYVTHVMPSSDDEAWKRFGIVASPDFNDEELCALTWETMVDLMKHYSFRNPVENAKLQLAWKKRQGEMLPSDAPIMAVASPRGEPTYVPLNVAMSPNRARGQYGQAGPYSPASTGRDARPTSPRKSAGARFVPSYKSPLRYEHVPSKVDTGARRPRA